MRDPNRINKYCDILKCIWGTCPDMRFGQLMMVLLGAYQSEKQRDPFFPEDEELFAFFAEHVKDCTPYIK